MKTSDLVFGAVLVAMVATAPIGCSDDTAESCDTMFAQVRAHAPEAMRDAVDSTKTITIRRCEAMRR